MALGASHTLSDVSTGDLSEVEDGESLDKINPHRVVRFSSPQNSEAEDIVYLSSDTERSQSPFAYGEEERSRSPSQQSRSVEDLGEWGPGDFLYDGQGINIGLPPPLNLVTSEEDITILRSPPHPSGPDKSHETIQEKDNQFEAIDYDENYLTCSGCKTKFNKPVEFMFHIASLPTNNLLPVCGERESNETQENFSKRLRAISAVLDIKLHELRDHTFQRGTPTILRTKDWERRS